MIDRSLIASFAQRFAAIDHDNLHILEQIYHSDVHFSDPIHDVFGLAALHGYCANLYENVSALHFDFTQLSPIDDEQALLCWTMTYRHPRLAGGRPIQVPGVSQVWFREGKAYRHIDHYDAGTLLYEHVPVLGTLIRWMKRRMT